MPESQASTIESARPLSGKQARQLRAERIRSAAWNGDGEEEGPEETEDELEQFEGWGNIILFSPAYFFRLMKRVDKIEHFSGMINCKIDKVLGR